MRKDDKIDLVWDRFVHRTSSFAEQIYFRRDKAFKFRPAKYCPVNCKEFNCSHRLYQEITKADINSHLLGNKTLGVYTTREDQTAKWLCIDIDDLDTTIVNDIAWRIYKRFGPKSCVVEFSGSRGYHIWLFFSRPIPAERVTMLGRVLTDGYTLEIYPRQSEVSGVGNLVKLPLGIQRKTGNRCWFVDKDFKPYDNQWEVLQNVRLIDDLGELPPMEKQEFARAERLSCMHAMMEQGLTNGERDIGLFRLACHWRENNIPYEYGLDLAYMVNARGEPLSALEVKEKVDSAYSRGYSNFPCQEKMLDHYCSSSCSYFKSKAKMRGISEEELKKQIGV